MNEGSYKNNRLFSPAACIGPPQQETRPFGIIDSESSCERNLKYNRF
jgi:hypothetical protein